MPSRGSDDQPQLKDQDLYEKLREEGNSKEKAARISNAAADRGRSDVGKSGGRSGSYEDWTVDELRERAKELDLQGYSDLKKDELIDRLRNH
ncbi:Rho termination factor [Rhodococcus triatomae]|uniref:Rho termination factor, N-terminal domain n=1 Tax=Rhodococcus triatomae TaxID=300028 RepID=A0A1G8B5N2_9NOCA|nr:Rho termination factor N-terminal domain-containing protein [Rhodococcus triatomae]QNG17572.1 Rho termination factor [Rhodococcus triatomae]QNG22760.1 Rho termination factor [Rhodococcus triatomae]SDH28529.1 Rho termination factor, N-terminal domain [Rhodococcus triatomae]